MKILIVDDSKTMRNQVISILSKHGFQIIEAEDGQDALLRIQEHADLRLIISDVNMPNLNGLDMLEKIKEMSGGVDIPIVMLSTESGATNFERAKKAGAKGWLFKPINPDHLLAVAVKLTSLT